MRKKGVRSVRSFLRPKAFASHRLGTRHSALKWTWKRRGWKTWHRVSHQRGQSFSVNMFDILIERRYSFVVSLFTSLNTFPFPLVCSMGSSKGMVWPQKTTVIFPISPMSSVCSSILFKFYRYKRGCYIWNMQSSIETEEREQGWVTVPLCPLVRLTGPELQSLNGWHTLVCDRSIPNCETCLSRQRCNN